MLLKDALELKTFDRRLVDKHLAEGKISQADYDKLLGDLPDDSDNYITTEEWLQKRKGEAAPAATEAPAQPTGFGGDNGFGSN
jgi:hypothetical protein